MIASNGSEHRTRPPLRLLIAEDEMMAAWHLVDMVHELGHEICGTVATQQAAIEAAARLNPDAILMDYRLGRRGNGLVAARRIREVSDTPIIFCTAYAVGLEASLHSLRNTCLIGKPIRVSLLKGALGNLFGVRLA